MAKKDKSAKAPTPDEVEAIFSDVDETGHTNASKARKERTASSRPQGGRRG